MSREKVYSHPIAYAASSRTKHAIDVRSALHTPETANRLVAYMDRLVSHRGRPVGAGPVEFFRRRIIPLANSAVTGGGRPSRGGLDWSRGSACRCDRVPGTWLQIRRHKWRSDLGRWERERSNYAEMAALALVAFDVPRHQIIVAPCHSTENQRTYESGVAVLRALEAAHLQQKTLNVFTYGPHARRSRLVYAKVSRPETEVGVVAWKPLESGFDPWWRSSQRAKELLF